MFKSLFSAAALATCVACVSGEPTQNVENRVVGVGFIENTLEWRGVGLDDITYAIGIFDEGGRFVVCGAAQSMGRAMANDVLRNLQVTVNGQVMINSMAFAPVYVGTDGLNGKSASCIQTSFEVVENPDFDVNLTKTRFRR